MKCILFGASGRLGRELRRCYESWGVVKAFDHLSLDITKKAEVFACIADEKPDLILNAAAWTDVTGAERHREEVFEINGTAVGYLAQSARKYDIPLIHFSTDYVFPGTGDAPWTESDRIAPLGVYGKSKVLGEKLFKESGARGAIVRLGWLHSGESDFVSAIIRKALQGEALKVVDDQWGTPSSVWALADWVFSSTERILSAPSLSVVHYVESGGYISRFEMASYLLEVASREFDKNGNAQKALCCNRAVQTMKPVELTDGIRPLNCRLSSLYAREFPETQDWRTGVDKSVEKVVSCF